MIGKSLADVRFEEGELKGRLATILHQGRRRFEPPTPDQQAQLEAIDSPERFEALSEAIMDAASWDDLLQRA